MAKVMIYGNKNTEQVVFSTDTREFVFTTLIETLLHCKYEVTIRAS